MSCIICDSSAANYKCPKCRAPYCSVPCCKKHKEIPCEPVKIEECVDQRTSKIAEYNYPTEDTVSQDRLKMLEHSEDLMNCLKNPHLRKILTNLDTCQVPDKMIKEFMQEPIFTEFVDECLKVVEPIKDSEKT